MKRFRAASQSRHRETIVANLPGPRFAAEGPNGVWAGDIHFLPAAGGFLLLAVVLEKIG